MLLSAAQCDSGYLGGFYGKFHLTLKTSDKNGFAKVWVLAICLHIVLF